MLFQYFLLTFFFIVRLALQITVFKTKHFYPEVTHPSFCHRHHPHSHLRPNPCSRICFLFSCSVPYCSFLFYILPVYWYENFPAYRHIDRTVQWTHMCPPLRCYNEHFAVFAFPRSCLPSILFLSVLFLLHLSLHSSDHHTLALSLELLLQHIPNASGHQSVGVQTTFWCTGKKC